MLTDATALILSMVVVKLAARPPAGSLRTRRSQADHILINRRG
jgi:hypothetical protein